MAPIALSEETYPSSTPLRDSSLNLSTGLDVRGACRNGYTKVSSGIAPSYLQANLIVLPSRYAADFRNLCARNPVPCPLIGESKLPGSYSDFKSYIQGVSDEELAGSIDIRRDISYYMVYKDGELVKEHVQDIVEEWTADHIAFLIGCSFSFETALTDAGLEPRHTMMNQNVPVYRTTLPLCKSGVFNSGTYVVSMRPYKKSEIEAVRSITRPYLLTHGEPITWGWNAVAELGITNIDKPDWGAAPLLRDSRPLGNAFGEDTETPVFWGCGVTPQEAVMRANLEGTIMSHSAGYMLVLDCRNTDIIKTA